MLLLLVFLILYIHLVISLWKKAFLPLIRKFEGSIHLLYLINTILLLPCIYFAYQNSLYIFYQPKEFFLKLLYLVIMLVRFFLLPHILTLLFTIEYIKYLKAKQFPIIKTVLFAVQLLLCIICLLGMEHIFGAEFNSAMSV